MELKEIFFSLNKNPAYQTRSNNWEISRITVEQYFFLCSAVVSDQWYNAVDV